MAKKKTTTRATRKRAKKKVAAKREPAKMKPFKGYALVDPGTRQCRGKWVYIAKPREHRRGDHIARVEVREIEEK